MPPGPLASQRPDTTAACCRAGTSSTHLSRTHHRAPEPSLARGQGLAPAKHSTPGKRRHGRRQRAGRLSTASNAAASPPCDTTSFPPQGCCRSRSSAAGQGMVSLARSASAHKLSRLGWAGRFYLCLRSSPRRSITAAAAAAAINRSEASKGPGGARRRPSARPPSFGKTRRRSDHPWGQRRPLSGGRRRWSWKA